MKRKTTVGLAKHEQGYAAVATQRAHDECVWNGRSG